MRIIVADPAEPMRRLVVSYLEDCQFFVAQVDTWEKLKPLLENKVDLLILDTLLIGKPMSQFMAEYRQENPDLPILFLSDHHDTAEAEEALQGGAIDYLVKPFAFDRLKGGIEKGVGLHDQGEEVTVGGKSFVKLESLPSLNKNQMMRKAVTLLNNVADSDITVLIQGESGVGKELFARVLHANSHKHRHQPFIGLNCASVPDSLLEAELFGSEKGSFTGSTATRIGKFEMAQRGILLLDEISEMDLTLQTKLLRVIQEREIYRIGGSQRIQLDVRLIATTNRDLREWVRAGNFREDLYYRLNVISIPIPPLRDRLEDIPVLARHILSRFNREHDRRDLTLTMEGLKRLCEHTWPGNLRELENVLLRTCFLTQGNRITKIHFDPEEMQPASTGAAIPVWTTIEEMERAMILRALDLHNGNRTHAANTLGISVRTLRNKLKLYRENETV